MDDALSVRELPSGDLEVGVHIADVSHFVREVPKHRSKSRAIQDQYPYQYHLPSTTVQQKCMFCPWIDMFSHLEACMHAVDLHF